MDTREDLLRKLKWLMLFRVLIVTFLLGSTVLIHYRETSAYLESYLLYLYIIIGSVYLLTLLYALLINRIRNLVVFAYFQISLDLVYVTAIVYVTGGIESIFSFLYMLSIINASILLYRKGGLTAASASSVLYGACLDLEYFQVIPPLTENLPSILTYSAGEIFHTIVINVTAFYVTAFLTSFLAEQAIRSQQQLQDKEIDYRNLEALHHDIIQNINSGILTVNRRGEVTSFNRGAQEITHYHATQALGRKFEEVFPLPETDSPEKSPGAGLAKLPLRFDLSFSRSDGKQLALGFSRSILRDKEEKEMGKILIFQDLSRLREMEEQIKRMDRLAAVGQLAAGMAHEIRNPLTSLSGSIQILRDELSLEAEYRHLMEIALDETKRLDRLITDFLLFAQPERGKKEKVNLSAIMSDTLDLFQHSAECRYNIRIEKELPPFVFVMANPENLRQVFWNLFKNAAQAQPEGGFIRVKAKKENQGNFTSGKVNDRRAKIIISDGGSGIPPEIQPKIFDPFFTTKEQGSGLGLAISCRILESHGGDISIRSEGNQGTAVRISLPLMAEDKIAAME